VHTGYGNAITALRFGEAWRASAPSGIPAHTTGAAGGTWQFHSVAQEARADRSAVVRRLVTFGLRVAGGRPPDSRPAKQRDGRLPRCAGVPERSWAFQE